MPDTADTFGIKRESKLSSTTARAQDAAEDMYGKAKDAAGEAADLAEQKLNDADDFIRNIIEQRPYTVAFAALALGFLLGKMGRRH
jgi:ElaB/YqjD/DUF883 family membrane-anchored ribosome-binding protein